MVAEGLPQPSAHEAIMPDAKQPITLEQLARLYQARNKANSILAMRRRMKAPAPLMAAKEEAIRLNKAYEAARISYKKQQKAAARKAWREERKEHYRQQNASHPEIHHA